MNHYAGTETHTPTTNQMGSVKYGQTGWGEFFVLNPKNNGCSYYPTMEAAEQAATTLNDKLNRQERENRKSFETMCALD